MQKLTPLLPFLLAAFACNGSCKSTPRPNACEPNPCVEANRNRCAVVDEEAVCLCNEQTVPRPVQADTDPELEQVCEPVGPGNCPQHAGDSAEPDDCLANAKSLAPGSTARTQTLEPVGDYDYFSFNGNAEHVYVATVTAASPLFPRVDLFDQNGALVAYDERLGEAVMIGKVRATAPYYVRVAHSQFDPSVAIGSYSITLESLGREDHGDSANAATLVSPSLSTQTPVTTPQGKFEYPYDQDWFSFSASTSQDYRVVFDSAQTVPQVSLFVGSETQPRFTTQQQDFLFDVPANTTAYLVLYSPENGGSYSYNFTRAPK